MKKVSLIIGLLVAALIGSAAAQSGGVLKYAVQKFTADTGYIRAWVLVVNSGPGPSDRSEMVVQFQDGFGKTYATERYPLPSMQPGEQKQIEAFSMVEAKDASITVTQDTLAINFYSLDNPGSNPKTRADIRKQARDRKL